MSPKDPMGKAPGRKRRLGRGERVLRSGQSLSNNTKEKAQMRKRYHRRTLETKISNFRIIAMGISYRSMGEKLGIYQTTIDREVIR